MLVRTRKEPEIKGLVIGRIGRKNSAQLFLLLHIFSDGLGLAAICNVQL